MFDQCYSAALKAKTTEHEISMAAPFHSTPTLAQPGHQHWHLLSAQCSLPLLCLLAEQTTSAGPADVVHLALAGLVPLPPSPCT